MSVRSQVRTTFSKAAPNALGRMNPSRRQRLVMEVVRAASTACTAEECGSLHRAIATLQGTWPVTRADRESHLAGLYAAVAETAAVSGAIVECGVGRGASLVPLARANQIFSPDRSVIGFDSFEGFPPPVQQDVGPRVTGDQSVQPHWDENYVHTWWNTTSLTAVRDALDAPCELVAGFFSDTLEGRIPAKVSLLHVDCDLYESTRDVLAQGLPRMQPGGMIIFDEYDDATWPGATTAIDEALADLPFRPTWDELLRRHVIRIPAA